MSDVTVVGLGAMGSALARAVRRGGRSVTVWNRSAEKMTPLIAEGATAAPSLADAVTASPAVLVCVDNYAVTRSLLGAREVISRLRDRTVIQLSTGSPRDARDGEAWFNRHGVAYLDGAILCIPPAVGSSEAQLLFAGREAAFAQVEPLLDCLGGDIRYLGRNVRAAAVLDLAWLCQRLGMILGMVHGANVCLSEVVGLDVFAALFPEGERARLVVEAIHANNFTDPSASVDVWRSVAKRMLAQAREAGINDGFPAFAAGLFDRAAASGYGREDVAAVIKVLRDFAEGPTAGT